LSYFSIITATTGLCSITLKPKQKIDFMLAYWDDDGSNVREHFMFSHKIKPIKGDTNRGWIDANVFGNIRLKK
jgi:hypothetical protein